VGETDTADNATTATARVGVQPVVSSITPNRMTAGTTIQVQIVGSNFVNGSSLSFANGSYTAPTVSNLVVQSSTLITATLTCKATGPKGTRTWDVVVTSPDGLSGSQASGFQVIR
jgi:hypothetical protein